LTKANNLKPSRNSVQTLRNYLRTDRIFAQAVSYYLQALSKTVWQLRRFSQIVRILVQTLSRYSQSHRSFAQALSSLFQTLSYYARTVRRFSQPLSRHNLIGQTIRKMPSWAIWTKINICSTLARQKPRTSLAKELQSSKTSAAVFQLGRLHNLVWQDKKGYT